MESKINVLMIGPGRDVKGGISTVVNSYFENGLADAVHLEYLPTMEDGSKVKKLWIAIRAYMKFSSMLKSYDVVHVHMAADSSYERAKFFIRKAHRKHIPIIIHEHSAAVTLQHRWAI